MKRIFYLLLWALGYCQMTQAQLILTPIVPPNPSSNVYDWYYGKQTAKLSVTNTTTNEYSAKLELKVYKDGVLMSHNDLAVTPIVTIRPSSSGSKIFEATDLLTPQCIRFDIDITDIKGQVLQGKMPAGYYTSCYTFIDVKTGLALTANPTCKSYSVTSYQAPTLMLPMADTKINHTGINNTIFRWTNVVPAFNGILKYRFRIYEVLSGQTPWQAIKSNAPIEQRDVLSSTMHIWTSATAKIASRQTNGATELPYVWTVQALDLQNNPVGNNDGLSEARVFNVVLEKPKGGNGIGTAAGTGMVTMVSTSTVPMIKIISPNNKAILQNAYETFAWEVPNVANKDNLSYKIKIIESPNGEISEVAINKSTVSLFDDDLSGNTITLPSSKFKSGKTYIWQVIALDNNKPVAKSIVNGFSNTFKAIPSMKNQAFAKTASVLTCEKLNFENNSLDGWVGKTGSNTQNNGLDLSEEGLINGRHSMVNKGFDPNVPSLPTVIEGNYAMRLGNSASGSEAESISYTFLVDKDHQEFSFDYALVLQDGGHGSGNSFFQYRISSNNTIIEEFKVVADRLSPYFSTGNNEIVYHPWDCLIIDLSKYTNQKVTIEFITADCIHTGHYGYAYIDGICNGNKSCTFFAPNFTLNPCVKLSQKENWVDGSSSINETQYKWAIQETDADGISNIGIKEMQSWQNGQAGKFDISSLGLVLKNGHHYKITLFVKNSNGDEKEMTKKCFVNYISADFTITQRVCLSEKEIWVDGTSSEGEYSHSWYIEELEKDGKTGTGNYAIKESSSTAKREDIRKIFEESVDNFKRNTYYKVKLVINGPSCFAKFNGSDEIEKTIFISSPPLGKLVKKYHCCENTEALNLGAALGRLTFTTTGDITPSTNYTVTATSGVYTVLTVDGGKYNWKSSDGSFTSNLQSPSITPTKAFERYYCTVTNVDNCSSVDTVDVYRICVKAILDLPDVACLNDTEIWADATASEGMNVCHWTIQETDSKGGKNIGAAMQIGQKDPNGRYNIRNIGLKLKPNTYYKITLSVSNIFCKSTNEQSKVILISSPPIGKRVTKYYCCEGTDLINLGTLVGRGPDIFVSSDKTVNYSTAATVAVTSTITGSNYTAITANPSNMTAVVTGSSATSGTTGILGNGSILNAAPYIGSGTVIYTATHYDWVSSDGTFKSKEKAPEIKPKKAYERYYCTTTNEHGCKSIDTVDIYYVENKDFDIIESNCFCGSKKLCANLKRATSDDCFQLKSIIQTPISYKWSTGETTDCINVNPNSKTSYSVTMTTPCGTYGKKVKTIAVEPSYKPTGGIPSITLVSIINRSTGNFTLATEDNKNIGVIPAYNATKYRLEVIDILSRPIYSKTFDAQCGGFANGDVRWNGNTTNGNRAASGTYLYSLYFTNCDGVERPYKRTITYTKGIWPFRRTVTETISRFKVILN